MKRDSIGMLAVLAAAWALSACGGGGGNGPGDSPAPSLSAPSGAVSALAASSGTLSALGGVTVNGQRFSLQAAQVIDDDTGAATANAGALEVGMDVDVRTALSGTDPSAAAEIHLHPLARGAVDAADATGGTITVMGQTIALTAATNFSDHRACVTAATAPCAAINGPAGLVATIGSGMAAVAGTYVTVHGYLYATQAATPGAAIVATLVAVLDMPTGSTGANDKAEGVVTAANGTTVTIGALNVDLSGATCRTAVGTTSCAGAFGVGQVVSAWSATALPLPVSSLKASYATLQPRLPVQTTGAVVALGGNVSAVSTAAHGFVLRGIAIDASALAASSLPAVGDEVRVVGAVGTGGASVVATSVVVLHAARNATYGFEGDITGVTAGTGASTFVVTVLGQSISVDGTTRLADHSTAGSWSNPPSNFNISNFQSTVAASPSPHVVVRSQANALGQLSALSLTLLPASTVAGISGEVDASPAPVDSSVSGTLATFAVHTVAIQADPAAFLPTFTRGGPAAGIVTSGDWVTALGTYANGTLTVNAPAAGQRPSEANSVADLGPPSSLDHGCF